MRELKSLATGLKFDGMVDLPPYTAYVEGKQHRTPFCKDGPYQRAQEKLELHSDLYEVKMD